MTSFLYKSAEQDVYANLLNETYGLDEAQVKARSRWIENLPLREKTEILFTLETYLKSLLCLGNPRNMPVGRLDLTGSGIWHAESFPPNHNFKAHTQILRDVMLQCVVLIRKLLGSRDRTYTFTRYLQNALIQDVDHAKVVREQPTQASPEESLALMRSAFGTYQDLAEVIVQCVDVNHKTFSALHVTVAREIERNTFFCPPVNFTLRPEYSGIEYTELLDAIRSVPFVSLHKAVMLALLCLFNVNKLLHLLEQLSKEKASPSLSYAVWAVIRSDLFSLSHFLRTTLRGYISDRLEEELLAVPAEVLSGHSGEIEAAVIFAQHMTTALAASGRIMDLELVQIFNYQMNHYGDGIKDPRFNDHSRRSVLRMRACIQAQIEWIANTLFQATGASAFQAFRLENTVDGVAEGERMSLLIWMFRYIVEAFILKLKSLESYSDKWGQESLTFMREFALQLRTLGYPVLQWIGYPATSTLLAWVPILLNTETIDPKRTRILIQQCEHAFRHIAENLSSTQSLSDSPEARVQLRGLFEYYLGADAAA